MTGSRIRVSTGTDRGETENVPIAFRDECSLCSLTENPFPLADTIAHGKVAQRLRWQEVLIRRLPLRDMDLSQRWRIRSFGSPDQKHRNALGDVASLTATVQGQAASPNPKNEKMVGCLSPTTGGKPGYEARL